MTQRSKLIELLEEAAVKMDCPQMDEVADYLLANGVVIPTLCKDCKKSRGSGCPFWDEAPYNKEDYCSYGERKDQK